MPSLFILSGKEVGRTFDFDAAIEIGRSKDADLAVRAPSVSRIHARIEPRPEGWTVIDAQSSNGVWVDHQRVEQALLDDGMSFRLGDLELRFRADAPAAPAPAKDEPELETQVAAAATVVAPPSDAPLESDEIELEGEWSEAPAPAPRPSKATAAPQASPKPSAPKSAQDREQRRAAALGDVAGARKTQSGGRVLQYNKVENRSGLFATDLSQQGAGVRWMIYVAVVLVVVALAYGAFLMTTTLRRQAADSTPDVESGEY